MINYFCNSSTFSNECFFDEWFLFIPRDGSIINCKKKMATIHFKTIWS